jgi:phospholipid/cholesterol/gamma-HCH transport system substrate-binding protein
MPQVLRNRVLGIMFVGLLTLGVLFTYAIFNKTFADVVHVRLESDRIGLQLPEHADVKVRGVRVGEVWSVSTSGDGATIDLALDPDELSDIPDDVTAKIIPKTLFGEKYVELVVPPSPSTVTLAEGDVIRQADVSVEMEQVLSDAYPLITTVQPADLAYTLNALATGLDGRGSALGSNLVRLDGLLRQLNPILPEAVDDLAKLRRVADVYEEVLPDLALTLDNTVLTGNTLVEKRTQLVTLLDEVTGLSDTTREFLQANADGIIELSQVSQPTLEVLAKYAPEFPCLTRGLVNWIPRMESVYRDHIFHINLEILPAQPTGYGTADAPRFGAKNGPHCGGLPNPPYTQDNPSPQPGAGTVDDGVESDHGKNKQRPGDAGDLP